jgi:lipoteichoic acid synthase
MIKGLERLQPYFISGFLYLAANVLLRCIDFFLLAPMFNIPSNIVIFFKCILNDIIWCGCVFTFFFPVYYFINLRFRRASVIICSTFFGVLFLIQIILVIFAFYGGKLLDKEIFTRPFTEIYTTVRSYGSLSIFMALGLIIILSFPIISFLIEKNAGRRFRFISLTSAVVLILSVFLISYPYKLYGWSTENNRFIINRAMYFVYEDYNYFHKDSGTRNPDVKMLSHFRDEYPDWQVADTLFPFYRNDNTPDLLSPYFSLNREKPDIVYIVIESLGLGITGENAYSGSFTPFLDSLANHSLYWENCFSTSQRSFGILPSLLGSLPNGNTGFQFEQMPVHTTIIRLLKENGYNTNMFYAGYYEFDNVREFMNLQGNDYYAPYYDEYKAADFIEKNANEWGYADDLMFEKSLNYLATKKRDENNFSLYVTLTTHNNLDIPDKEWFIDEAKSINKRLSQKQQKRNNSHIDHLASFIYLDNALRHFFKKYKELPKYDNTIFVITGDHYISNFGVPNRLNLYRVPLFIYSPALNRSKRFKSMVSVLDISPSIWSMLFNNYSITRPKSVSWLSDGLDTTESFSSHKKVLFMQDNRDRKEFVYNNFFFSYDSVYEISDYIRLRPADKSKYSVISEKYNLFKAIESYVYNENRLMPAENLSDKE